MKGPSPMAVPVEPARPVDMFVSDLQSLLEQARFGARRADERQDYALSGAMRTLAASLVNATEVASVVVRMTAEEHGEAIPIGPGAARVGMHHG